MGVYLLGEENQESFICKAIFSLIVINTFYHGCVKIQFNSKPKCIYVHKDKNVTTLVKWSMNFLLQNGAIFMQRMELFLKAHISLSTFWWRNETMGETARIPTKEGSKIITFQYWLLSSWFNNFSTILAGWLGNTNFWASLLMHTGLKRNKLTFVFCNPELYILIKFPDYILSNF